MLFNSQLEYRKTSRGANEISKLPQAKCLWAEIDETCNKKKKLSAGEKSPFYLLKWNMCADLVQRLGVKKKLSAKCFREGTKVKKVKNDKKRIVLYVAFISKNIILKESLTVRL